MRGIIRYLHSGYYNYLVVLFALLFAFRPYDSGFAYIACWKILFTGTFIAAIFNCKHHRYVKTLAIILAVPTLIFTWVELFVQTGPIFATFIALTIGFMIVATTSIIYDVILRAQVTMETLRGVVCAYFMVAFVFAYIYYLIEYVTPGSFHLIIRDNSFVTYSRDLSQLTYFSFITLLTIGFGDITPVQDVSQTFTVLEGLIGQFYIAILVARIVAVYSLRSLATMAKKKTQKNSQKNSR